MPHSHSSTGTATKPASSASRTIVQQVAAATGQEPTQLQPLYDVIDPDALDRFLRSIDPETASLRLQFVYEGYRVTVDADGTVSCVRE